jgi:hypothetical protein
MILMIFFLPTLASSAKVPKDAHGTLSRRTSSAISANQFARWDTEFGTPGMNDVVREILVDSSGSFIAAGGFTSAGGTTANRIASWDGNSWQAMGAGFNNTVFALAEDWNGNIFAAGNFTSAGGASAQRIAIWDGSSWSPLGDGIAGDAVRDLAFDNNGNLYAAGKFTSAGGYPAAAIAKWNGGVWSNVGSGVSGYLDTIYALAVDGANIYAAGSFNQAGSDPAINIAKWNGSKWYPLGDGLNSGAYALQVVNGELYVGGTFTQAGSTPTSYIARWDGSSWSDVGGGMNNHVTSLGYDGKYLYAGGLFTEAGGVSVNRIAIWDGSQWSPLGDGTDNVVTSLVATSPHEMLVGGYFTAAGSQPAYRIARWFENVTYLPLSIKGSAAPLPPLGTNLAPPSDFDADTISPTTIRLTWTDNSDNEDEFIIENSPDGVNFTYYGTSGGPDVEEMFDVELGMGTTHCYRIIARNTQGDSDPSNTDCATTNNTQAPQPVSNLHAQVVSSDRILLTWTNNSSCEGYDVYESTDGGPFLFAGKVLEGNLPGAYVENLPPGDTYAYIVVSYNSIGFAPVHLSPVSNTVNPPDTTSNTLTRFSNNSVYPVISLQVDGVEQFPSQPMGIPPGAYYQMELAAGSHNYRASTGFWSGGSRTEMYVYQTSFNQLNNTTVQIPFNNPTIAQILTRFGSTGYYTGDYWMGTLPNSAAFRFYNNGTYTFYRNGVAQGSGNYSMVSYTGNFMLTFQVTGYQNAQGRMDERSSSFYMKNGPTDWPTIQYTYDGH